MRKLIFLFIFCLFLPSPTIAQTARDERWIEEEKRESLRATETEILEEEHKKIPPTDLIGLSYFEDLLSRRVASCSDALKTIIILLGVEDQYKEPESQISFLNEKNIIPKGIVKDFNPSQPLRKGLAAYMFCKVLKIKGGFWMRIFGLNQRYALKELVYEGIIFPGTVKDIVSGRELILILTKSAEYLTKTAKNLE